MLDKSTPSLLTEPCSVLPNANDYRELAIKIQGIARQTRSPFAWRKLLSFSTSYQGLDEYLNRTNSMYGALITVRVSLYSGVVSAALGMGMFTGPASANTIDPLADTMVIVSQGMRSVTGDTYSEGMRVETGPWAGDIYSQGMMMTTGHIYSQGMGITFLGETTYSPRQGDVGSAPNWNDNPTKPGGATSFPSEGGVGSAPNSSDNPTSLGSATYFPSEGGINSPPNWSDNPTNLEERTNSTPPDQGCTAANCNGNGNGTNPQTASDPPKVDDTGPSNLSFTTAGGTLDNNSTPWVSLDPQIFGLDNQSSDPPPPASGDIATWTRDPIPEPASLSLLGPALLLFGLVRRRRDAEALSLS